MNLYLSDFHRELTRLDRDGVIAVANRFAAGLVDDPPAKGRDALEAIARAMAIDLKRSGVDDSELDEDLILIRDYSAAAHIV